MGSVVLLPLITHLPFLVNSIFKSKDKFTDNFIHLGGGGGFSPLACSSKINSSIQHLLVYSIPTEMVDIPCVNRDCFIKSFRQFNTIIMVYLSNVMFDLR